MYSYKVPWFLMFINNQNFKYFDKILLVLYCTGPELSYKNLPGAVNLKRFCPHNCYDFEHSPYMIPYHQPIVKNLGGISKMLVSFQISELLKYPFCIKKIIFWCMDNNIWVKFQIFPLKFHTKYLEHTCISIKITLHASSMSLLVYLPDVSCRQPGAHFTNMV